MLLRIEFDRARFSEPAGKRLLGHLTTLLESMAASVADRPLGRLPMLAEKERREMVRGAERSYEPGPCLHELFERRAAASPEAVAVVCEGSSFTYRELNRRANRLAHRLRARGVGPETLVGLCLERSLELVVGILGILKAGGAYLPLDPDYPKDRLAFMLEDAGVRVIVAKRDAARPAADGTASSSTSTTSRSVARGRTWRAGRRREPRLRHLHLGLDRPAQGRHGDARERRPASSRRRTHWFGFGSARRLDALPLLRLRLLGLGAVGRAPLRRPARRRPVLGQPLAGRVLRAAAPGAGHRPQPDAVGLPPAHPGGPRHGREAGGPRLALRRLRRRGARPRRACAPGSTGTATISRSSSTCTGSPRPPCT